MSNKDEHHVHHSGEEDKSTYKKNEDYGKTHAKQEDDSFSSSDNKQADTYEKDGDLWDKKFESDSYINSDGVPSRVQKRESTNKMPSYLVTMFVVIIAIIIITAISYFWFINNRSYNKFEGSDNIQIANSQSESLSVAESESLAESEEKESTEETTTETTSESETTSKAEETTTKAAETTSQAAETSTSQAPTGGSYVVKAGDNLYRIALNHGVSEEAIMQANGMTSKTVFVGQELVIP